MTTSYNETTYNDNFFIIFLRKLRWVEADKLDFFNPYLILNLFDQLCLASSHAHVRQIYDHRVRSYYVLRA
jgi:hypothetical protein